MLKELWKSSDKNTTKPRGKEQPTKKQNEDVKRKNKRQQTTDENYMQRNI